MTGASSPPLRIAEAHPDAVPSVRACRSRRDSAVRRLLGLSDPVWVLAALLIALALGGHAVAPRHRLVWNLVAVPLMVLRLKL